MHYSSPTLETAADRSVEELVVERLLGLYNPGTQFLRLPPFSVCDYAVSENGSVIEFVEIKARKEPHFTVRTYGGLMLKKFKADDLSELARLTNTPVNVVFAFGNGSGAFFQTDPTTLTGRKAVLPPVRRNYRGLAADNDLVYMLDWRDDLDVLLQPLDSD